MLKRSWSEVGTGWIRQKGICCTPGAISRVDSTSGRASPPSRRRRKPSRPSSSAWARRRGDSVADLLTELAARHAVPESLREAALELDKAYIPTRYPNAHPSGAPRTRYTRTEAARLIDYAAEIIKFCSSLLPEA